MKYLGRIIELSYKAQFILEGSFAPPDSTIVYTKTLEPLGKVAHVFGAVERPYIAVRPLEKDALTLDRLGSEVYVGSPEE